MSGFWLRELNPGCPVRTTSISRLDYSVICHPSTSALCGVPRLFITPGLTLWHTMPYTHLVRKDSIREPTLRSWPQSQRLYLPCEKSRSRSLHFLFISHELCVGPDLHQKDSPRWKCCVFFVNLWRQLKCPCFFLGWRRPNLLDQTWVVSTRLIT